jgi:hypothetical protein
MEKDARSLDQKTQAELSRRAHILHKKGKSRQEIADILGVHLKTVDRWRANHKRQGVQRLIKDSKKKVFLIVDNLRVHHSAPVKEWVELNKERIALLYLPSYSPERNPDEYLNGDLKSALGRKAPLMGQSHLEKNLIGSMRRLSKSPQHVASYFEHPAVAYAKAA